MSQRGGGKRKRKQYAQVPTALGAMLREAHDRQLRRKLHERLTTHPARRGALVGLSCNYQQFESLNPTCDCRSQRLSLSAYARRIRRVLDVAADEDATIRAHERRTDSEVGVRCVCFFHRTKRDGTQ